MQKLHIKQKLEQKQSMNILFNKILLIKGSRF